MRPPLDLRLPRSRRWPPLALAASVAVHVLVLLVGAIEGWLPRLPRRDFQPQATPQDTVPLTLLELPRARPGAPVRRPGAPRRPRERRDDRFAAPRAQLEPALPPVDTGAAPEREAPPAIGRIGPGLAQGKLWVRPLPLPPKELAKRLQKTHAELADSAVTAVVQAYLDSIASDPASQGARLPEWTTHVAGRKFGLDSNSIYVAGIKIPAAVLALLPIPGGNIDQNRAYSHMLEMRADIQRAAQRASNLDEFKERIRDTRLRREREQEFERNRQTPPAEAPQPRDSAADVVTQPQ